MGILIKFIIKSACEKKARTLLILLSITLSAGLFFSSGSLTENLTDKYEQSLKNKIGNADILITAGANSPSTYFTPKTAESILGTSPEYIVPVINVVGTYKISNKENEVVSLSGINFDDYAKTNELVIIQKIKDGTEIASPVIVSEYCLNKYGLSLGDTFELKIEDNRKKFQITQIAAKLGKFADESSQINMITPYDSLSETMNQMGKVNTLYIKVKMPEDVKNTIELLQKYYSKYDVKETFISEEMAMQVGMMSSPLMLMSGLVTLMSIFIIHSSFKVIMIEKLPAIGTFRSIGADKKLINKVMMMESMFYGVIGGILSCLFGIGILYILTSATMPADVKEVSGVQIKISMVKLIFTFIFANIVCFTSSVLPIKRISKIPIKDVVLNTFDDNEIKNKSKKDYMGFIFIIAAISVNYLNRNNISLGISGLCLIMCIFGFIKAIPSVLKFLYPCMEFISKTLFRNIGLLAAKNCKGNKSINNSISLIAIGIAILFFVSTIGYSLGNLLTSAYDDVNYNVSLTAENADINMLKAVKSDPDVKDARGVYVMGGVKVKDLNKSINVLYSSSGVKSLKFMNLLIEGDESELIKKLQTGRNIIIGKFVAQNLAVSVGNTITLEFGKNDKEYTIIGISGSSISMQNFALISDTYFKKDTGESFFYQIDVISKNPELTAVSLKEKFSKQNAKTETKYQMQEREKVMIDSILNMITAFAILALLIGVVGIVNNLLISFIERKRSLAVLRSIGISKFDMIKMVFIEALISGVVGGIMGIIGGLLICNIGPSLIKAAGTPFDFVYNVNTFVFYLIGGIIVTIAATVIPAIKTSKLKIIESIKFE